MGQSPSMAPLSNCTLGLTEATGNSLRWDCDCLGILHCCLCVLHWPSLSTTSSLHIVMSLRQRNRRMESAFTKSICNISNNSIPICYPEYLQSRVLGSRDLSWLGWGLIAPECPTQGQHGFVRLLFGKITPFRHGPIKRGVSNFASHEFLAGPRSSEPARGKCLR